MRQLPKAYRNLVREHEKWLKSFCKLHLQNWKKLLKEDREGAMCEAVIRCLLESHGCLVEPTEEAGGSSRSPDFRCMADGRELYVEATCIKIATATRITGLEPGSREAESFSLLTRSILYACKSKASQCSGLEAPALLAVGTFHADAAELCFGHFGPEELLSGERRIRGHVDTRTGQTTGRIRVIRDCDTAAFLKRSPTEGFGFGRLSISGLLLCDLCRKRIVHGVLHPKPVRGFDRALLPDVPFLAAARKHGRWSSQWV